MINGNKKISTFSVCSQIELKRSGVICFATDGTLNFLTDEQLFPYDDLNLKEFFKLQKGRLNGTPKLDDRTLIKKYKRENFCRENNFQPRKTPLKVAITDL